MVLYMAHEHAKYIGKNGVLYIWCFPWRIYAASWQQQAGYAASNSFGWLLIHLSWPAWATFGLSWVQLVASGGKLGPAKATYGPVHGSLTFQNISEKMVCVTYGFFHGRYMLYRGRNRLDMPLRFRSDGFSMTSGGLFGPILGYLGSNLWLSGGILGTAKAIVALCSFICGHLSIPCGHNVVGLAFYCP